MLHKKEKDAVIVLHRQEIERYNALYEEVKRESIKLYQQRDRAVSIISDANDLINSIANKPKEITNPLKEVTIQKEKFLETERFAQKALRDTRNSELGMLLGTATGISVVGGGVPAAMWVATTFGTASTGTAISSLSGVAAEKAALAWLGSGALSAGGAGVAGGEALLALSGPIGWGIVGASIGISVFRMSSKNKKAVREVKEQITEIRSATDTLQHIIYLIKDFSEKTENLSIASDREYYELEKYRSSDYLLLDENTRYRLGKMVNHLLSLSECLNKTINEKETNGDEKD